MTAIARRAGVHPATVSRALRDDPRITAEQRARIRTLATELGYRPNPLVAALMTARRTGRPPSYQATFGYITKYPATRAATFARDFGGIVTGARARALAQGYRLEEFNLDAPDFPVRRATEILRHRNIHGLLIAPLHSARETVQLDWTQFNTVAIGYSLHDVPVSRVAHNHFTAYAVAARQCRAAGWRRLGLVLQRRVHEKVEKRWVAATLLDQSEQPAAVRIPPLLLDATTHPPATRDDNESANIARFAAWLKRHRPEVLLCANVRELRAWLRTLQYAVPRDLNLVSLDRRAEDEGIAGIDQDYAGNGASAIDLLIGMTQRNERGLPARPVVAVTDGVWLDGPSLARREHTTDKVKTQA